MLARWTGNTTVEISELAGLKQAATLHAKDGEGHQATTAQQQQLPLNRDVDPICLHTTDFAAGVDHQG